MFRLLALPVSYSHTFAKYRVFYLTGIANDLFRSGYAAYLEVITAQSRVLEAEL